MAHPLLHHHGVGTGPQLGDGQALQVGVGAVELISQDVPIDGGDEIVPALSPGQQLPQPGGGDVHQTGQGDGGNPGSGAGPLQILPLRGEDRLPVLLRAAKGAYPRQLQNLLRLAPPVEGQEHVRTHEQPQLRLRVFLPEGRQRVGGVALPRPVQLQRGHLRHLGHQQGVGHDFRHSQPVLGGWGVLRQLLVGRVGRGHNVQLVQTQRRNRRLRRRQVPQVGRVEGSAKNSDFHH